MGRNKKNVLVYLCQTKNGLRKFTKPMIFSSEDISISKTINTYQHSRKENAIFDTCFNTLFIQFDNDPQSLLPNQSVISK